MTEPGNAMAAAGRGHLRASHADRDQVIDTLKAAFVQGMLSKDELDARVAQAFASRTYAELAALTSDIGAALIRARAPSQPARPPKDKAVDSSQNKFVNRCACGVMAVIALNVTFQLGNLQLFLLVAVAMLGALLATGAWKIRSRNEKRSLSSNGRA